MKNAILAVCCSALTLAPSLAEAAEEFLAVKPVLTRFGIPGEFIIDGSAEHLLVEAPTSPRQFGTTASFVEYMVSNFNALPIEKDGVAVGYELNVTVIGTPFVASGDKLVASPSAFAALLGGSSGKIQIGGLTSASTPMSVLRRTGLLSMCRALSR